MSLESLISGFGGLWGQTKANKMNAKAVAQARQQNLDTINSLDWEPMYASQTVPQYQKTQSPVARSYLESFLMGNNPNMTFSGSPNAGFVKQQQQQQQNAMFGTPDQRVQQQNQWLASNPYQVQTPTRPVMGEQSKKAAYVIGNPNASHAGVDPKLHDDLVAAGILHKGEDLPFSVREDQSGQFTRALRGALDAGDTQAADFLLHPKLDRPHAALHGRQVRKANNRAKAIVARYGGAPDDAEG